MNKEDSKELKNRKKYLAEKLYNQFYHIIENNLKVRKLLTEKEIKNGIKTLVDEITRRIIEKEQKTGRKLSLEEIKGIIMTVLDEFTSTSYII